MNQRSIQSHYFALCALLLGFGFNPSLGLAAPSAAQDLTREAFMTGICKQVRPSHFKKLENLFNARYANHSGGIHIRWVKTSLKHRGNTMQVAWDDQFDGSTEKSSADPKENQPKSQTIETYSAQYPYLLKQRVEVADALKTNSPVGVGQISLCDVFAAPLTLLTGNELPRSVTVLGLDYDRNSAQKMTLSYFKEPNSGTFKEETRYAWLPSSRPLVVAEFRADGKLWKVRDEVFHTSLILSDSTVPTDRIADYAFYLPQELELRPDHFERMVSSSVKIVVKESDGYSIGTGILISNQGHLLTAKHTIISGGTITTQSGIAQGPLHILYQDKEFDFAILEPVAPLSTVQNCLKPLEQSLALLPHSPVWLGGYGTSERSKKFSDLYAHSSFFSVASGTFGSDDFTLPARPGLLRLNLRAVPGMSGGPVVDESGSLLGTTILTDSSQFIYDSEVNVDGKYPGTQAVAIETIVDQLKKHKGDAFVKAVFNCKPFAESPIPLRLNKRDLQ